MTDEQIIIKGLDVCSSSDRTCEDCPYSELIAPRCMRELTRDAYDLINQTKSEAIKEFVKQLKEKLQWDVEFDNKLVFESDIDTLVKEMTEEK